MPSKASPKKHDHRLEIANRITAWLTDENYRFKSVDDERATCNLLLDIRDFGINLIVRNDKLDSLILAGTIGLTPQDKKAYDYLKPQKRIEFVQGCEMAILQIGVDYEFQPSRENAHSITLFRVLFHDGLTKQSFFDAILKITHALEMVNLQYTKLKNSVLFP